MTSLMVLKCMNKSNHSLVSDEVNGEIICSDCGYVVKERLSDFSHHEKISHGSNDFSSLRTGGPTKISIYDMGISSTISSKNTDAAGNNLPINTKKRFDRLRMWDNRSKSRKNKRGLKKAFVFLDSIKAKLALPEQVVEKAATIYRKASKMNLIRGKSISAMIAASVYVACREYGITRSIDEIAIASNISRRYLSRSYKRLIQNLSVSPKHAGCIDYLNKIATKVKASERSSRTALKILQDVENTEISIGKNPVGLAAAAIYLSCAGNNEKISYPKLERECKVSSVTIRKNALRFRKIASKYINSIEVST